MPGSPTRRPGSPSRRGRDHAHVEAPFEFDMEDDEMHNRIRRVLRAEASAEGEAGLIEFVRKMFNRYGHRERVNGRPDKLMTEEEFRKAVASMESLRTKLTAEEIGTLFHALDTSGDAKVSFTELVSFASLTRRQVRSIAAQVRTRMLNRAGPEREWRKVFNALATRDKRELSAASLTGFVATELHLALTEWETLAMLELMDVDHDGKVTLDDLSKVLENAQWASAPQEDEASVVDLRVTTDRAEEEDAASHGYRAMQGNLNAGTRGREIRVWIKKATPSSTQAPIVEVRVLPRTRDTNLVAQGFACLPRSLNKGNMGKDLYIWTRRAATPEAGELHGVRELGMTKGNDRHVDDAIWIPPGRGFRPITADDRSYVNCNARNLGADVFLWVLPASALRARRPVGIDGGDHLGDAGEVAAGAAAAAAAGAAADDPATAAEAPPAASDPSQLQLQIEHQVREALRNHALAAMPNGDNGPVDFRAIFKKYDTANKGELTRSQFSKLLREIGVRLGSRDIKQLIARFDSDNNGRLKYDEFTAFAALTPGDMDEVTLRVKRAIQASMRRGVNFRVEFERLDRDRDGKLSRSDFQSVLANQQIALTDAELAQLIGRFDVDGEGSVDFQNFIAYMSGGDDTAIRQAERVGAAEAALRALVLDHQSKRKAPGTIDTRTVWRRLVKENKGSRNRKLLTKANFERELNKVQPHPIRLSDHELDQLVTRIAPLGGGKVDETTFKDFVLHMRRSNEEIARQVIERLPEETDLLARLDQHNEGQLPLPDVAERLRELCAFKPEELPLRDVAVLAQYLGADMAGDGSINVSLLVDNLNRTDQEGHMHLAAPGEYDDIDLQVEAAAKQLRDTIREDARRDDGSLDFEETFSLFDKNNDRSIPLGEFRDQLRLLNISDMLNEQGVRRLMQQIDTDGNGLISFQEFVAFATRDPIPLKQQERTIKRALAGNRGRHQKGHRGDTGDAALDRVLLRVQADIRQLITQHGSGYDFRAVFSQMDRDGSGSIELDEFRDALRSMGVGASLSEREVRQVFDHFDADGSGSIEYEELAAFLTHDLGRSNRGATGKHRLDRVLARIQRQVRRLAQTRGTRFNVKKSFSQRDVPYTGKLSRRDFRDALSSLGIIGNIAGEDIEALMDYLSPDERRRSVDYEEFVEMVLHGSFGGGGGGRDGGDGYGSDEGRGRGRRPAGRHGHRVTRLGAGYGGGSNDDDDDEEDYDSAAEAQDGVFARVWRAVEDVKPSQREQEELKRELDYQDRGMGTMPVAKFRRLFKDHGVPVERDDVDELVRVLDPERDGFVDFTRFLRKLFSGGHGRGGGRGHSGGRGRWRAELPAHKRAELLQRIRAALQRPSLHGMTYHQLMRMSDVRDRGAVDRRSLQHQLRMLACELSDKEARALQSLLRPRADKLVDYNELFQVVMDAPPAWDNAAAASAAFGGGGPPPGYGAPSGPYGAPSGPYGAQPGGPYGAPPGGPYGAPGGPYGAPGGPYGAPPGGPYGQPPVPYGQPPMPYGQTAPGPYGQPPMPGGPYGQTAPTPYGQPAFGQTGPYGAPAARDALRERVRHQLALANVDLRDEFRRADHHNTGWVSPQVLQHLLQRLGVLLSQPELHDLMRLGDPMGDARINYREICRFVGFEPSELRAVAATVGERLRQLGRTGVRWQDAFNMYDVTGSGRVTRRDFALACSELGLPLTNVTQRALADDFASIHDKELISYRELVAFCEDAADGRGSPFRPAAAARRGWVDGDGYDGVRASGGGGRDVFNPRTVERWLDAASPADRRQFSDVYRSLERFREDQERTTRWAHDERPLADHGGAYGGPGSGFVDHAAAAQAPPPRSPVRRGSRGDDWGAHTPTRTAGVAGSNAAGKGDCWRCVVCFHTQSKPRQKRCEICDSSCPNAAGNEVLWECANCTFRNPEANSKCEMCGTKLAVSNLSMSTTKPLRSTWSPGRSPGRGSSPGRGGRTLRSPRSPRSPRYDEDREWDERRSKTSTWRDSY